MHLRVVIWNRYELYVTQLRRAVRIAALAERSFSRLCETLSERDVYRFCRDQSTPTGWLDGIPLTVSAKSRQNLGHDFMAGVNYMRGE